MPLTIVTSDRFADHLTPPGHPERVERAVAMQAVAVRAREEGRLVVEPREASDSDLLAVHDQDLITTIASARGRTAMLDPDTFLSPESDAIARLAAGAVLTAVDAVLDGPAGSRALAMVRPPGHHAEADRAMGFCLYNNVAVGAARARRRGVQRVAVVDFDVHHGNGTQWIFYEDSSVLFVSSHQFPFYPGTGAVSEVGRGAGTGLTVNLPMEAGAGDADFDLLYRSVVAPIVAEYRPGLLLISAGFDAHEHDPLAGMRVTTGGFAALIARLTASADAVCDGRIVFVTEGGYDTQVLAACCQHVIEIAGGGPVVAPDAVTGETRRAEAALAEIQRIQAEHWSSLR